MIDDPQRTELKERLAALSKDEVFRAFRPLVEGVQAAASSGVAELPELTALVQVLLDLRSQMDGGAPIADVIQGAHAVRFNNPNLSADQVFQAQNIYNLHIDKVRDPQAVKPPVVVAIVLAVMNGDEAAGLWDGTALAEQIPSTGPEIEKVRSFLDASAAEQAHYGATARDWRPFGTAQEDPTIAELVSSVVAEMNTKSAYDPPLAPSLRDVHELAGNWSETLVLRQDGCVLLVDGISMLHPAITDSFRRSGLDLFPKVSIVRIDPTTGAWEAAKNLKVVLRLELNSLEFVRRSMEYTEDPWGSSDASNAPALKKWVRDRVFRLHPPKPPGLQDRFPISPTSGT
jgi:hypothetical protein